MIDKELLIKTVEDAIAGTGIFIVDISVTPANDITVELDSPGSMDIDTCADITRRIGEVFDRDVEDYSLEVGSAGLTAPFRVRGQYLKNIGNNVEVLTRDGRKLRGILSAVAPGNPDAPADIAFTVDTTVKVKEEGAKRPVMRTQPVELHASDCKSVVCMIEF